jgi:hypothetical protein
LRYSYKCSKIWEKRLLGTHYKELVKNTNLRSHILRVDGRVVNLPGEDVENWPEPALHFVLFEINVGGEKSYENHHQHHQEDGDRLRDLGVLRRRQILQVHYVLGAVFGLMALQVVLVADLHFGLQEPIVQDFDGLVAAERISLDLQDEILLPICPRQTVKRLQILFAESGDVVALQIQISEFLQTLDVEVETRDVVVAQVYVVEVGQVAEDVRVFEELDLVLLQVEFVQLGQVAVDEDVVQVVGQRRVRVVGEGVGEVQLLQVVKIREHPGVVEVAVVLVRDRDVVVVENQSLDARDVVEGFALDLSDAVVAHVDDFQLAQVGIVAEHVHLEHRDVVAGENQHLGLFGELPQHRGVPERQVCAVHGEEGLRLVVDLAAVAPLQQFGPTLEDVRLAQHEQQKDDTKGALL